MSKATQAVKTGGRPTPYTNAPEAFQKAIAQVESANLNTQLAFIYREGIAARVAAGSGKLENPYANKAGEVKSKRAKAWQLGSEALCNKNGVTISKVHANVTVADLQKVAS